MQALPVDTGMAYIIVQHLSSDHESHLAELLDRQTPLEVVAVTKPIEIKPNVIYVRTPTIELKIDNTQLVPTERITAGTDAFYPIDRFFISLAHQRREKAIGIILSGMGTDGSRGVDAIKEYGGLILVQSPESAQFTGMPKAVLRYDVADLVASPEQLARRLVSMVELESNLLHEESSGDPISSTQLIRELLKLIKTREGVDFSSYRSTTIRRRVEKRMLITQTPINSEYLQLVKQRREECRALAKSFLIGVTRFFRDTDAFTVIQREIIPKIFAQAPFDQPVRVWVPSCSTGEEAYSLAMLLEEYRREHAPHREFKVLASDVDANSVKIANRGFYPDNIPADVSSAFLDRYFTAEIGGYQVIQKLRDRILFAVQDLLHDPPFIRVDLISCRNFLIYIKIEAQARILSSFHFALNPEGFLFLGPSESLGKLQEAFHPLDRRWKIFSRRVYDSLPLPSMARAPVQSEEDKEPATRARPVQVGNTELLSNPSFNMETASSIMVRDPFAQYLADQYAPTSLFVTAEYEIVYINGDVDGLLTFPRQHTSFNLQRVLSTEVSTVLCSAVDDVFKEDSDYRTTTIGVSVPDVELRGQAFATRVQRVDAVNSPDPVCMITLRQVDNSATEGQEPTGKITRANELIRRRIQTLEEQLLQSNLKTQKLLAELEATNEELQTSNRELLASNEEMQSTNEELQSVNEELYTVNNELQQKNEQLKLLNSDVNHLLESTDIGTIFLDERLLIRRFTPTIRRQFDLHSSDIGRPISSFSSSFEELDLVAKCQEVLTTRTRHEEEVVDRKGQNFLLRILSHEGLNELEPGLVVTFININDLVDARKRLEDMATKYQALLVHSQDTIIIVGAAGRIREINKWVKPKQTPEELIGRYFSDLIVEDSQKVLFDNTLRSVFSKHQPVQVRLALDGPGPAGVHLDMAFIPAHEDLTGKRVSEPQVLLIIRDVSEHVRHEHHTNAILEDYRHRLNQMDTQGGLIDPDGQIVYLNRNTDPNRQLNDYKDRNVKDFLTSTGTQKFERALERIANGSFEELVHYLPDDLLIAPIEPSGTRILYRPIIADRELRLIGLTAQ